MFATVGSRGLNFPRAGGYQRRWCLSNRVVTVLQATTASVSGTYGSWFQVLWNVKVVDEVGAFSFAAKGNIVVPANWTRCRIRALSNWFVNSVSAENCYFQIQRNGNTFQHTIRYSNGGSLGGVSTNGAATFIDTGWLSGLNPGDVFTMWVLNATSSGAVSWASSNTWPTCWVEWDR